MSVSLLNYVVFLHVEHKIHKMKKLVGLFITGLLFLSSCGSVPLTGRQQVLLVSDQEVVAASLTQYNDYLKTAKLSTNTQIS